MFAPALLGKVVGHAVADDARADDDDVRPRRERAHADPPPPLILDAWDEMLARGAGTPDRATRGQRNAALTPHATSDASSASAGSRSRGDRAKPVHRWGMGRVSRRGVQPGHQPERRDGRDRGRCRDRRPGPGRHRRRAPRLRSRPTGRGRRPRSARRCSTGSPTCSSATSRSWPARETLNTGKAMRESRADMPT